VSKYLKGAPRVEPAVKTKAARKRVETGKIIVELDGEFKMSFEGFVGTSTSEMTLGATWHLRE
jgi:hypothetical protein